MEDEQKTNTKIGLILGLGAAGFATVRFTNNWYTMLAGVGMEVLAVLLIIWMLIKQPRPR